MPRDTVCHGLRHVGGLAVVAVHATLPIVMSSNSMNMPIMTAMSVHHFPFTGDLLRDYELDSA